MIQKHLELSCNAHCANPNFSRQFLPRSQLVGDRGILHVIKHNILNEIVAVWIVLLNPFPDLEQLEKQLPCLSFQSCPLIRSWHCAISESEVSFLTEIDTWWSTSEHHHLVCSQCFDLFLSNVHHIFAPRVIPVSYTHLTLPTSELV